jgi:shikimate dehydrogenase
MRQFGLIGFPLSHSFSKKYFSEKFQLENIEHAQYELFELENLGEFKSWMNSIEGLVGLNVTIPHKQNVIPFLDEMDEKARQIGAVNVIKKIGPDRYKGYNSDYYGFKLSVEKFMASPLVTKALLLGTGGASKAVKIALEDMGITCTYVSRKSSEGVLSYDMLTKEVMAEHFLIINSTPLGMSPNVDSAPEIPYQYITNQHYLYDLVYNPAQTKFMRLGQEHGAKVVNGYEMLVQQAEKAWEIWNS